MKKLLLIVAALAMSFGAYAQAPAAPKTYEFKVVKELPITSVKNQASSGTCWCFSTISFLESELMRKGLKDPDLDLSEMFVVSKAYQDKAEKYIRLDGALNYGQGSDFGDVIEVIKAYGIVPNTVMDGLNYGETRHMHSEMAGALTGYLQAIAKVPNRHLSTAWKDGLRGILDAYLGACPETFQYKGRTYTPQQYRDAIGLNNLDEYISLTSFTHHPFYTQFAIEVPDNWRWTPSYNLPIDELMEVMYNAIDKGYTIAWGSDVSETGFDRQGLGIMPDVAAVEEVGSDQARWVGVSAEDKARELAVMRENAPEMTITQEMRQKAFDNKETTDDHGMHIYGTAVDQRGTKYFMVKNSWGVTGKYDGIWYVSDSFVRYKTLNILVHKDAIPSAIKAKLGIR
ncbi:MAG: aminopeptidase [Bacteroidales bacterium]|nr:aminopeptidase [Bacteroidales bacterium]MBO7480362.1 aminopeptidase [Bacteroidales bacterium]